MTRRIRRRRSQRGFIQTLELLILMAMFGSVIYFALELVNRWLIQMIDPIGGSNVIAYDDDGSFIVRTKSFVGNEGPARVYRVPTNEAAILGVRSDGFTTRQRIYFTDSDDCTGNAMWMIDPTPDAGTATQFLSWDDTPGVAPPTASNSPLPAGVGYGHPVSDFYTIQGAAFAMGPMNTLYRALGSIATGLPPGFDPTVVGYPASEWASERYGDLVGGRCRKIGEITDGAGPNVDVAAPNAEQIALYPWLVMVDASYTVDDATGNPYQPDFWAPVSTNNNVAVTVDGSDPSFFTTTAESDAPALVPFTDADGVEHTAPGPENTPP